MVMDWLRLLEIVGMAGGAAVGLRVVWALLKKLRGKLTGMFGISGLAEDLDLVVERLDKIMFELSLIHI